MSRESLDFALIGSGAVASHIAPALVKGGMKCKAVYSPTLCHAETLAERLSGPAVETLSQLIDTEVDFVLISVKDDAIADIAKSFPHDFSKVVLHTSGGTSIDALEPIKHRGVLYPMQTFTKNRPLDITEIPIFPEAADETTHAIIDTITAALGSQTVHHLSSNERVRLHLASVFACNFVNHLYTQADEVMSTIGLDFTALAPLVRETLNKAIDHKPNRVQTGPAARGDQKTIDRHLALLEGNAAEVYSVLTKSIMEGIRK